MMFSKFKIFFLFFTVFGSTIFLVFQFNHDDVSDLPNGDLVRNNRAVLKNISYSLIESCVQKWTLTARCVFVDENNKIVLIKNPKMVFFFEDGKNGNVFPLSAKFAIFYMDTKIVSLFGDVSGFNQKYRIETKLMKYNHDLSLLESGDSLVFGNAGFSVGVNSVRIDLSKNKFDWEMENYSP